MKCRFVFVLSGFIDVFAQNVNMKSGRTRGTFVKGTSEAGNRCVRDFHEVGCILCVADVVTLIRFCYNIFCVDPPLRVPVTCLKLSKATLWIVMVTIIMVYREPYLYVIIVYGLF